ncbi:MAG: PEP-CTERM sorting domain-containing protein [Verrucomicrobia bacterium]|nr:PEP-CTERM sorting domain-containing protein [Verrucomicrobiota bacterium]
MDKKNKFLFLGAAGILLLVRSTPLFAGSGIFESYGIFSSVNQAGTSLLNQYYDMQATTANPDFNSNNFGTFDLTNSGNLLQIKGGEVKTYKNGLSDVFSATINYRVYETSIGPGSIAFTSLNLPFNSNLAAAGDQKWQSGGYSNNLLSSLSGNKNFTIEVFLTANSSDGTWYSNGGVGAPNYKATFSTVPEPSTAGLLILSIVGAMTLRRRRA